MKLNTIVIVAFALLVASCSSSKRQDSSSAVTTPSSPPSSSADISRSGPAPDSIEYFNSVVGNAVLFDYDKYDLSSAAQATLSGQAEWLNQNPMRTLTIEGHCDERGTREYNLGLGDRRASTIKGYLVSLGITAGRIKTLSYGKERPVCIMSTNDCWRQNRRGVSAVH
jgi:peptidoglycan-associated lipoprotein